MKNQDIEQLGFLIHDVARLMRRRLQEHGSEYDLTPAQWQLLFRLLTTEGMPQGRLAELLEIEPISVSRLVDRMAEAGWVQRRAARTDRRVRMIYPTPKAQAAYQAIKEIGSDIYDEALSGMNGDERRAVVGALQKMADNLNLLEPRPA